MTHERLADAGAVVSVTSFLGITLQQANEVAQFVLAIVGIISGIAATYYYITRANK
jgi:hypothetical protein